MKSKISKEIQRYLTILLMRYSYSLVQINVSRSCGNLDIVAEKSGEIHFFEVQYVSCEKYKELFNTGKYIPSKRLIEIQKTAQLFMREIGIPNSAWYIHIIFLIYSKNNTITDSKFLWDFNF